MSPQIGTPNGLGRHYTAPIGMKWSKNSCAYDLVFTPIFFQWCTNGDLKTEFTRIGSPEVKLLFDGFVQYEAGQGSLENARDAVRRHMVSLNLNHGAVFGAYTSIYAVCTVLLKMNEIIWEKFYLCPNGHYVHHSYDSIALLRAAATPFTSIAQWVSTDTEQMMALCRVCQHPARIRLKFCRTPPL